VDDPITTAIAALESQRSVLGDAVVDVSIASLRATQDGPASSTAPIPVGAPGVTVAPARQRRQVTVLFADVAGFTALSERLDVEDIADALNALWSALDRQVIEHGGRVDKHIGDAVMALWGVDGGREDDAERAVRCALAMQAHVGDFVDRIGELAPDAVAPSLRVGLNTGPALLASVGLGGEFSAIGDAVNTASRIEASGGPGEVVIGRSTYRLVRGVFFVRERPPVMAKGKSEPLTTYSVEGLRPRAFRVRSRGLEGIDVDMVGRSDELAVITSRTRRAIDEGMTLVTLVTGEPGVGKSRLHFEFRDWLEVSDPVRYFEASATEELRFVPYGLLRELLAFRFEIADTDHADTIRTRMLDGFRTISGSDDVNQAHVLGHVAGWGFEDDAGLTELPGPAALHDRVVEAMRTLLGGAAHEYPVIVVLDDVHWADAATLTMLEQLLTGQSLGAVHVVLLAREVPADMRSRLESHCDVAVVALSLLDDGAARALVREILARVDDLPDDLVERIVAQAGGNPFFVEEIVSMLLDAGAVVVGDERFTIGASRWRIDRAALDRVTIPTSVAEVVERRLDGLDADLRTILEAAAVVGAEHWDEALAEMLGLTVEVVQQRMSALERRQFVQTAHASSVEGTTEYSFRHALSRDVTYEAVLKRRRTELHLGAGRWYARRLGGRGAGRDAVVAQHFQRGGDLARAGTWWLRTGRRQEERGSFAAARTAYQLAADLRDDHVRREALGGIGRAATATGDVEGARVALDAVLIEGRAAGDVEALLPAIGEYIRLAVMLMGEHELADQFEDEGRAIMSRVSAGVRADFLRHLATRHLMGGDPDRAVEAASEAVAAARVLDRPIKLAMVLNHLAHGHVLQGRTAEAVELSAEVMAIGVANDNRRLQMFATAQRAFAAQRDGELLPAIALFREAREGAVAIDDTSTVRVIENHLGECLSAAGRLDEAEAVHLRCIIDGADGGIVDTARALLGLAMVAHRRGDMAHRNRLASFPLGYAATSTWSRLHARDLPVTPAQNVTAEQIRTLAHAVIVEAAATVNHTVPILALDDPPGPGAG
jgi:class 3 adenylate cyclase/tetratricopeptide (TPR) repeat protein